MKKSYVFILAVGFLFGVSPANADDVTIEGFADITYANPAKLKSTGCQELKFDYITNSSLARENTVFVIQLVHNSKKIIYGETAWFSTTTSNGADALPAMSRIGTLKIKVCRKAWVKGKGIDQRKLSAITPGTFRLYLAGGYLDPDTGSKSGDKVEVFKSLKLT